MSFYYPALLVVAAAIGAGLLLAYGWLQRQRTRALAEAGLIATESRRMAVRRHLPPLLFIAGLTVLLLGAARPYATVAVPRAAGTVVLAFDVSNSMAASDVQPSRLAAAQAAAIEFVQSQPDTVDIGVVAFNQGALTTHLPSNDRDATIAAINRLTLSGDTSLGQAILASLTAIAGQPATLPDPSGDVPVPDLGYWGSATVVLLSDGEDTGGPDALAEVLAAAELAATAGVRIETVGVGTVAGATIQVDGYQVATSLNEELLMQVAETTRASYHRAEDARSLADVYRNLDLRITLQDERTELTGVAVALSLLILTVGGLLMISWFGRLP